MIDYEKHTTFLLNMETDDLKALYNSGMMPMPLTKEGYYDFDSLKKIQRKCGIYWGWT